MRIGEWLGDVPADWDFDKFCSRNLSQNKLHYDHAIQFFWEMAAALKRGDEVWAIQSGGFAHLVYSCGLYDGWPFWIPRPCYSYKGPISAPHTDEFYNLIAIRVVARKSKAIGG